MSDDYEPDELTEAFSTPEVETAAPPPTGKVTGPHPKKTSISWNISVDEAVKYGFNSIKGVFPYLILIISCYALSIISFYVALSFTFSSEENTEIAEKAFLGLSFIFLVIAILIQLSLMIGLGYKFGGDILLRAVRFHHLIEKKK